MDDRTVDCKGGVLVLEKIGPDGFSIRIGNGPALFVAFNFKAMRIVDPDTTVHEFVKEELT